MLRRLWWIIGGGALLALCLVGFAHGPRMISAYAKTQREIMVSARSYKNLEAKAKEHGLVITQPQGAEHRHPNFDLFEEIASFESTKKGLKDPYNKTLGKHISEDPKTWAAVSEHLKEFADFPPTYGPRAALDSPRHPFQDRIATSVGEYAISICKQGDINRGMVALEQLNDLSRVLSLDPRRANIISLFALNRDFGFAAELIINSGKATPDQLARIVEMCREPVPDIYDVFGAEVVELSSLMDGIHDYLEDEIKALNSEGRNETYPSTHRSAAQANRAKLLQIYLDHRDQSEQMADSEVSGIKLDEIIYKEIDYDTIDRYALRTLALVYEQYGRIARRTAQIRAVVGLAASPTTPEEGMTTVTLGYERIPINVSRKGDRTTFITRSSVHDRDFDGNENLTIHQAAGVRFIRK
ncbi:hypothetical protein QPK87_06510 [Kamptonema cortianum]|nr:hypothetical protein [Geitlerinema splendidum]MDK3156226.1 hypothetical protein [Kamptonema cortianum]